MTTDGNNDRFDDVLRDALAAHAEQVLPAGDGLSRIQTRVAARRHRLRWLRPAVALGTVAALSVAGVGAYALVSDRGRDTLRKPAPITSQPPQSESPSPSPSATTEPTGLPAFPRLAIFPFTSATAERTWEDAYTSGGSQPWKADAIQVATTWVTVTLGQPDVTDNLGATYAPDGRHATVTLGRVIAGTSGRPIAVTDVALVKYGAAWIVVGAADPNGYLTFTSPSPGSLARTPQEVSGPGFGVDEAVTIDVRDATTATSYGTATTSFGNGTPQWNVAVSFTQPTGPDGVLVAVRGSAADGGPATITAEQLQYGEASGTPAAPQYFYAVKNQRITKFAARNGAAISYVTDAQPGGGASDPQFVPATGGDEVFYLQGGGTCANTLMMVAVSGPDAGKTSTYATPDAGYVISGYAIQPDALGVSYYETACDTSTSPQAKLVTKAQDNEAGPPIKFRSIPPGIEGDPAALRTAYDVAAWVRTGTQGYLARYHVGRTGYDSSPTPTASACAGWNPNDGLVSALDVDGAGQLWFVAHGGGGTKIVRCNGSTPTVVATVPTATPSDLDVDAGGSAVLVADDAGHVWRWDGSGPPTQLHPSVPLDHITW